MKYKEHAEDFIVEEIIDLPIGEEGKYLYVKLTKTNWNTLDVIKKLQNFLHIPRRFIGFCGSKDKKAITTQYISIKNIKEERINSVSIKDVELQPLHYGTKPLSLGDHKENKFKIKLDVKPIKINFVTNYFGEQRFGKNNVEIGLAILKKDFDRAATLIDKPDSLDPIRELKNQDRKLTSLYLYSVQSLLWNNVAKRFLEKNYKPINGFIKVYKENITIPLIAFDTEFKDKTIEQLYKKELKTLKLTQKDFITRTFPECLPTTQQRPLFIDIKDINITNNTIEFTLPKGSYATTVLKKLETFLKN